MQDYLIFIAQLAGDVGRENGWRLGDRHGDGCVGWQMCFVDGGR